MNREPDKEVRHMATVVYRRADGTVDAERFCGWSARDAATTAYRRAKSAIMAGAWRSYRMTHTQQRMMP